MHPSWAPWHTPSRDAQDGCQDAEERRGTRIFEAFVVSKMSRGLFLAQDRRHEIVAGPQAELKPLSD